MNIRQDNAVAMMPQPRILDTFSLASSLLFIIYSTRRSHAVNQVQQVFALFREANILAPRVCIREELSVALGLAALTKYERSMQYA